jgi:hypothetical protein
MRNARRVVLAISALTAVGCGGSDRSEPQQVHTTNAGTIIVHMTDKDAGLKVEIQDDNLYVQVTDDAPKATRDLAGEPLGGACEVDGGGGVQVSRHFPIYWREDPGDWGTAVLRPLGDNAEGETVAEHVASCRIFATKPTGVDDQAVFNEATDQPIATVKLRR